MADLQITKEVRVVCDDGDWVLRDLTITGREDDMFGEDPDPSEPVVELETPDGATYELDAETASLLVAAFGELGLG